MQPQRQVSMAGGGEAGFLSIKLERAYKLKDMDLLHKMVSHGTASIGQPHRVL